ncbi:MAG: Flp family type IVb pilin [Alphaproteobacteria bacterium]|nr:Flp family type IVb pilin [Alphaproteobacteria bacterium]MBV9420741.1 Flp family type IVb pilin [Alphaproteobacteria bacterium]MBV9541002.1 Flp family type IVb pilin [Alphaproteobacteria bacterium]MBV9903881.1 Flp family type IVb pilin [Alphaproteobacteria bacterium]
MGEATRADAISDAAGGHPAHPHAARSVVARFLADRSGATAIEYAMIAVFLSILIVAGVTALGTKLTAFFNSVAAGF